MSCFSAFKSLTVLFEHFQHVYVSKKKQRFEDSCQNMGFTVLVEFVTSSCLS